MRRLDRRVGDFQVEHPVERGGVVAGVEERAESSPGFVLDGVVLAGEFTGGIEQLLAELAHARVEARELALRQKPDARLWKGEGFSPTVTRRFAADPGDVAEARVLGVAVAFRSLADVRYRPRQRSIHVPAADEACPARCG